MPFDHNPRATSSGLSRAKLAFLLSVFADAFCKIAEFHPVLHNQEVDDILQYIKDQGMSFAQYFELETAQVYGGVPHSFCNQGLKFIGHESWTDDASMAFCLAEAMQQAKKENRLDLTKPENKQKFTLQLMYLFYDWWFGRRNSGFGIDGGSIGLGGVISNSMYAFAQKVLPEMNHSQKQEPISRHTVSLPWRIRSLFHFERFPQRTEDQISSHDVIADTEVANSHNLLLCDGNGSIMRLGPIGFASSLDQAMLIAEVQSRVTTPGHQAAACSQFLAYILFQGVHNPVDGGLSLEEKKQALLSEGNFEKFLEMLGSNHPGYPYLKGLLIDQQHPHPAEQPSNPHREYQWRVDFRAYEKNDANLLSLRDRGYYGAYVMDGLALALNIIHTSKTAAEAIAKVRLLKGDSDSVGTFVAAMAAVMLDTADLPDAWLHLLDNSPVNKLSPHEIRGFEDMSKNLERHPGFLPRSTDTVPQFIENFARTFDSPEEIYITDIHFEAVDLRDSSGRPLPSNWVIKFVSQHARNLFLREIGTEGHAKTEGNSNRWPTDDAGYEPRLGEDGCSLYFYAYRAVYGETAVAFRNGFQQERIFKLLANNSMFDPNNRSLPALASCLSKRVRSELPGSPVNGYLLPETLVRDSSLFVHFGLDWVRDYFVNLTCAMKQEDLFLRQAEDSVQQERRDHCHGLVRALAGVVNIIEPLARVSSEALLGELQSAAGQLSGVLGYISGLSSKDSRSNDSPSVVSRLFSIFKPKPVDHTGSVEQLVTAVMSAVTSAIEKLEGPPLSLQPEARRLSLQPGARR